jgi:LytS/YehU family sensor histidine kinase
MTFWSFGETSRIELSAQGAETLISITSESRLKTTIMDWGKNAYNVQQLAEEIQRALSAALIHERIEMDAARARFNETEARLQRLQAQHEAHFLYNTLAHVRALVDTNAPHAGEMLDALTNYLRSVSSLLASSSSTLGAEFEAIRGYLGVMNIRLGSRLTSRIELPDSLKEVPCIGACALPLVENAIKHGIEPQSAGGSIDIRAYIKAATW